VGKGARRRIRLGVAAVAVVGARGSLIAVVIEGDEGTGGRTVDDGQPSLGHPADHTRGR
jgi:hypothetical protein